MTDSSGSRDTEGQNLMHNRERSREKKRASWLGLVRRFVVTTAATLFFVLLTLVLAAYSPSSLQSLAEGQQPLWMWVLRYCLYAGSWFGLPILLRRKGIPEDQITAVKRSMVVVLVISEMAIVFNTLG